MLVSLYWKICAYTIFIVLWNGLKGVAAECIFLSQIFNSQIYSQLYALNTIAGIIDYIHITRSNGVKYCPILGSIKSVSFAEIFSNYQKNQCYIAQYFQYS